MPFTHPDQLVGGRNMAAFLDMLGFSEGTTTVAGSDDGYNVNVGGKLFTGYDRHPRIVVLTRWSRRHSIARWRLHAWYRTRRRWPTTTSGRTGWSRCWPRLETARRGTGRRWRLGRAFNNRASMHLSYMLAKDEAVRV